MKVTYCLQCNLWHAKEAPHLSAEQKGKYEKHRIGEFFYYSESYLIREKERIKKRRQPKSW